MIPCPPRRTQEVPQVTQVTRLLLAVTAAVLAFAVASRARRGNPWVTAGLTGLVVYSLLTFLQLCAGGG